MPINTKEGGPSSGIGSSITSSINGRFFSGSTKPYNIYMDKFSIICSMSNPINGLKLRKYGKIDNAFLGKFFNFNKF